MSSETAPRQKRTREGEGADSSEPGPPMDDSKPEPLEARSPEDEAGAPVDRNSMAELENELAALLDDAPLIPDDDDEDSGVFEPPPGAPPIPMAQGSSSADRDELSRRTPALSPRAFEQTPDEAGAGAPPRPRTVEPSKTAPPRVAGGAYRTLLALVLVVSLASAAWLVGARSRTPLAVSARPHAVRPGPAPRTRDHAAPFPSAAALRGDARHSAPANADRADSSTDERRRATPQAMPPAASTLPPFDPIRVLTALAPAGIEASRCRRSADPEGRVYVKVVVGQDGSIESVSAGSRYRGSETEACIERKLRQVDLPSFSGEGGPVVLPVTLK